MNTLKIQSKPEKTAISKKMKEKAEFLISTDINESNQPLVVMRVISKITLSLLLNPLVLAKNKLTKSSQTITEFLVGCKNYCKPLGTSAQSAR
jgi:maltodextrin utilization protein YvdJ